MNARSADTPIADVEAQRRGVGLLTGGDDRSYALGLACSLASQGVFVDFIGSDKLDAPELHGNELILFRNLRGDQNEQAPVQDKVRRILKYYVRLLAYSLRARPRIFHILWNNKFELLDRTVLMLYYRLCGRKVVFTAHNVNAARRDSRDSMLNRVTLRIQYRLAHHIFVHTEKMKQELHRDFGVREDRVSVIPFGINNTSPRTSLTPTEAKQRVGLPVQDLALLFFGQIAPYKGLEYLVDALPIIFSKVPRARLLIAGKVKKGAEAYWHALEEKLAVHGSRIICRIEHIPDSEVEVFFKAADVVVLPYVHIFQSGVPFLAYSFGLPVVATDVGALREEIVEGETGFVCAAQSASELAAAVGRYADSHLYEDLANTRARIAKIAQERHSWDRVATITRSVYGALQ
jgi:glycosyltransferase involved in cell wall biosynthesis